MKHSVTTRRFSARELLFAVAMGIILVAGTVNAVTVPNVFQKGKKARAADVNANFDALVVAVTALEAQVATLQGDLATTQADLTAAQGTIATLQSSLATAQGNIATNTSGISANVGNISSNATGYWL